MGIWTKRQGHGRYRRMYCQGGDSDWAALRALKAVEARPGNRPKIASTHESGISFGRGQGRRASINPIVHRLHVHLDHLGGRRPRASSSCLFQEVYSVQQCKTDPSRRRERSGACARAVPMRAKASVGSGDRRSPRTSSARPFSEHDFWRFGPDKGTPIDFWPGNKGGWRGGGKSGRGRFCGARHAPRPP